MNKQFNDDHIISLYQQGADEMPSKTLDHIILSRAEKAVESDEKSGRMMSNRWWPYSGIAAAIVAVVVLAPWQYYQDPALISVESAADSMMLPVRGSRDDTQTMSHPVRRKSAHEAHTIVNDASPASQASESKVAPLEMLADDAHIESFMVTDSTTEAALPEHRPRAVKSVSQALRGMSSTVPLSEFVNIIEKVQNKELHSAETALIKLLKEKPDYHNKIPEPLETMYQALLKNGKLTRPEQTQKHHKH